MSLPRLHDDQIDVSDALVERLVAAQFPQWAHLPRHRIESDGTIQRIDRLGENLVIRIPFVEWGARDAPNDQRILPLLAPRLPVAVPRLLELGAPAQGMPWPWGVYEWIEGRHPHSGDELAVARGLIDFVLALRSVDIDGPASPAAMDFIRDDAVTRPKIEQLAPYAPVDVAISVWDEALAEDVDQGQPVWLHGDLMPGNLLVEEDSDGVRLNAVLDWGAAGLGARWIDLLPAWVCLDALNREIFLNAVEATDAERRRARGLALRKVAWGLPYYERTNPGIATVFQRTLDALIAERA
jgi:aminoglycoside phosphotransferase (APT) family kinase protein